MTSTCKTILITGASGFIGGVVAEAALRRGLDVRTLSRRDWVGAPWVPVENRHLGALPFNIPAEALRGVDAIVHLANTTGGEKDAAARAVNVDGTRRLLAMAREAGVRKVVYISSQSAREDAISAYGKTKLEAEAVVRESGLAWTIMRPGLVYGSGDNDLYSRMAGTVKKLPVIPLLGGGRAAVQPIHAEDLSEAILRCLEPQAQSGATLNLGRAKPVTLRRFLSLIAVAQRGRPKPMLSIPLAPFIAVASACESIGLKLPVNSNNLKGLKKVEPMQTADSLRRLKLSLRPLEKGLREAEQKRGKKSSDAPSLQKRSLRVGLVGAGRIGMFHALTLERQRGIRLTALIDPNPKAAKFLHGMGVRARAFASLREAQEAQPLDAVIVATPPKFHLPATAEAAAAGLGVFVEKPLSRAADELDAFRAHAEGRATAAGYYAPCLLHFQEALKRLRGGEFGRIESFEAFCLQGYFPGANRWEVKRTLSGGGALINTAGHVLSMVHEAFGDPSDLRAEQRRVYNTDVEDALVVDFKYDGFGGRMFGSWAIRGFPQLENRLVVFTDKGALVCNNTMAVFLRREGGADWLGHQMDYDVGFNLAPDYIGGGVSEELRQWESRLRGGPEPRVSIPRAAALERVLFMIYDRAPMKEKFEMPLPKPQPLPGSETPLRAKPSSSGDARPPLILDVRSLDKLPASLVRHLALRWDGVRARASQVAALMAGGIAAERISVVVPDFMNYARIQNSAGAVGLLKSLGAGPGVAFVRAAIINAAASKGVTMWAGAQALLEADLARLPRGFRGEVLVFNFLADMAAALRRADALNKMTGAIRRKLPKARAGIQTNIFADMMEMLVYLDEPPGALHVLSSRSCDSLAATIRLLHEADAFRGTRVTVEINQVPAPYYAHIVADAAPWLNGADALALDALADPALARLRRRRFATAWRDTFPGTTIPPAAL